MSLPKYLVPAAHVRLDTLPPDGKIDRNALPAAQHQVIIRSGYEAPRTPVEEMLASILCEVLKLDRFGGEG